MWNSAVQAQVRTGRLSLVLMAFVFAGATFLVTLYNLMLPALAVTIVLIVALLILSKWTLGVYLLAFILPFEDLLVLSPMASATKGIMALTLLSIGFQLFRNRTLASRLAISLREPTTVAFGFFTVWALASTYWAVNPLASVQKTIAFIGAFALMVLTSVLSENELKTLWTVLITSAALSVLCGFVIPSSTISGRFTSGGLDPNDYAGLLVMTMYVFLYSGWAKRASVVYVLAVVLGVFLSGSRTGAVALLVTPILSLNIGSTRFRRLSLSACLVGAVLLFAVINYGAPLVGSTLISRYTSLTHISSESTWAGRIDIWRSAISIIKLDPLTGVGAGNFPYVCEQYSVQCRIINSSHPGGAVAHNIYLSVTGELGIVGLVLFLAFQWNVLRRAVGSLRSGKSVAMGILVGFIVYFIMGQTLTWEYAKVSFLVFGSTLALRGAGGEREKRIDAALTDNHSRGISS